MAKYNNELTESHGKVYHSKVEAQYDNILRALLKEGRIKKIERQVRYALPDFNWLEKGTRRFAYIPDFVVTRADGHRVVLEVKGFMPAAQKVKYAFFQYVYQMPVYIIKKATLTADTERWLNAKPTTTKANIQAQ